MGSGGQGDGTSEREDTTTWHALGLKVITYLRLKLSSARGTLDARKRRC